MFAGIVLPGVGNGVGSAVANGPSEGIKKVAEVCLNLNLAGNEVPKGLVLVMGPSSRFVVFAVLGFVGVFSPWAIGIPLIWWNEAKERKKKAEKNQQQEDDDADVVVDLEDGMDIKMSDLDKNTSHQEVVRHTGSPRSSIDQVTLVNERLV